MIKTPEIENAFVKIWDSFVESIIKQLIGQSIQVLYSHLLKPCNHGWWLMRRFVTYTIHNIWFTKPSRLQLVKYWNCYTYCSRVLTLCWWLVELQSLTLPLVYIVASSKVQIQKILTLMKHRKLENDGFTKQMTFQNEKWQLKDWFSYFPNNDSFCNYI